MSTRRNRSTYETARRTLYSGLALMLLMCAPSCYAPQAGLSSSAVKNNQTKRTQPGIRIAELEKRIHTLINRERSKHGLSQLALDSALSRIARGHSRDMAKRNYFDHNSPEGHDFSYRYKQEGYSCAIRADGAIHLGAENILQNNLYDRVTTVNGVAYYDWNSEENIAETTVQGWMNSPGHRKNILTPHWRNEGLGVVIAPDDKVYITQNFC